jgi:hypothetical protein
VVAAPVVAALACSLAGAKAAIRQAHPKVQALGPDKLAVTPAMADGVVCGDFTRDGRVDMGVTIASGGTAGDIAYLVFVSTASGWRLALAQGGYKVGLFRVDGDFFDSQPVYRKNDPNCCPTGGFDHRRWHWNGTRFVVVRRWHDAKYRS